MSFDSACTIFESCWTASACAEIFGNIFEDCCDISQFCYTVSACAEILGNAFRRRYGITKAKAIVG